MGISDFIKGLTKGGRTKDAAEMFAKFADIRAIRFAKSVEKFFAEKGLEWKKTDLYPSYFFLVVGHYLIADKMVFVSDGEKARDKFIDTARKKFSKQLRQDPELLQYYNNIYYNFTKKLGANNGYADILTLIAIELAKHFEERNGFYQETALKLSEQIGEFYAESTTKITKIITLLR